MTSARRGLATLGVTRENGVGVISVALAAGATQGSSYIALLLLATLVSAGDFGAVKVADSVISIAILVGSMGVPSYFLCRAQFQSADSAGLLLRGLISVLLVSVTTAVGALTILWATHVISDRRQLAVLAELVWICVLSAANRATVAYLQGAGQIVRTSRIVASFAVAGLALCGALTAIWGVEGWICARYISEAGALTVLVTICRVASSREDLPSIRQIYSLVRETLPIAVSLILRAVIDGLPILVLARYRASATEIGTFGLATVAAAGVGLLTAAVGTVALPKLAAARLSLSSSRRIMAVSVVANVGISIAGLCGLYVVGPPVLARFFPTYSATLAVAAIILWAVPVRTLASTVGLMFLAYDRNEVTAVLNLVLLAASLAVYPFAWHLDGVRGVALSVVILELSGATLLVLYALLSHRRWAAPSLSIESTV